MQETIAISMTVADEPNETLWSPTTPLPYMPQLDALRTFAVLAVMVSHFLPRLQDYADLGGLGVKLFFVLSGFLITGILLRAKVLIERDGQSPILSFRQFYIRRALRIFPAFYLVLLIITVIGISPLRSTWGWHASYLSNIYFFMKGDFDPSVSHFWSLAVEEQFYLIWPWIILLLPRTSLPKLILGVVLVGPIFRLTCALLLTDSQMVGVLPFSCFDKLGMGALLAVWSDPSSIKKEYVALLRKVGLYLGLPLLGLAFILRLLHTAQLFHVVFSDISVALIGVWLISKASIGFKGQIGRLLEWHPIVYIGTISYGVYLYHNFMLILVPPILRRMGLPADSLAFSFIIMSLATIGIASASWHFFERPLNNLKKHFSYKVSS
ncbi:MAG TPA: acyltransferase [Pyrinomonadaceae bacterium]|jgi:peptidoglycan/LPS O-acetylase OafA/YrhL|nr:acyltransferase [Pyrinomonadaceae bacterium]